MVRQPALRSMKTDVCTVSIITVHTVCQGAMYLIGLAREFDWSCLSRAS